MNLSEFIRQNNIKCKDGEDFDNSPEFLKMREFGVLSASLKKI